MYLAKSRGRANCQFFDPGMAERAYAALVLEGQLAQALERGEFELLLPAAGARCATARWSAARRCCAGTTRERGLLLPDEFIPVAEQRSA